MYDRSPSPMKKSPNPDRYRSYSSDKKLNTRGFNQKNSSISSRLFFKPALYQIRSP